MRQAGPGQYGGSGIVWNNVCHRLPGFEYSIPIKVEPAGEIGVAAGGIGQVDVDAVRSAVVVGSEGLDAFFIYADRIVTVILNRVCVAGDHSDVQRQVLGK